MVRLNFFFCVESTHVSFFSFFQTDLLQRTKCMGLVGGNFQTQKLDLANGKTTNW